MNRLHPRHPRSRMLDLEELADNEPRTPRPDDDLASVVSQFEGYQVLDHIKVALSPVLLTPLPQPREERPS